MPGNCRVLKPIYAHSQRVEDEFRVGPVGVWGTFVYVLREVIACAWP